MPYDNEYNRNIADHMKMISDRYAKLYGYSPVDGRGRICGGAGVLFQMGNASKRDGEDNMYNNDLELPEVYYKGCGNGFAEGSFRDTGFGEVEGVGSFDKSGGVMPHQPSGMSGGFALGELGDSDFWNKLKISHKNDFKMSDLSDPSFWKSISVGSGLNTPHCSGGFALGDLGDMDFWRKLRVEGGGMSGGFALGDLGDTDFWKKIRIEGGGMSGGGFWDDFKTGFNMVFEPGSKYILKPLSMVTGTPALAAGLTALGYGRDTFEFKDLSDPAWWALHSLSGGAFHRRHTQGQFPLHALANHKFHKHADSLSGGSWDDFINGMKSLGDSNTYTNIAHSVMDPLAKGLDVVTDGIGEVKGKVGLGYSGGAILGNPDPYPVKGNSQRLAGRGRKPTAKQIEGCSKPAVIIPKVNLQGPNGDMLAMSDSVLSNGVPPRSQLRGSYGGGKPDGRKKRAEIVKQVMAEKKISMIEASKYVKANNLY